MGKKKMKRWLEFVGSCSPQCSSVAMAASSGGGISPTASTSAGSLPKCQLYVMFQNHSYLKEQYAIHILIPQANSLSSSVLFFFSFLRVIYHAVIFLFVLSESPVGS